MSAATSDNTVAIYALVVSGIVGLAGPIILSYFASRRTREELNAGDARQRRALRHEGEREVLDAGAVLLQRFRLASGRPFLGANEDEAKIMIVELGAHLARLLLWFPEDSDVVGSFEAMFTHCVLYEEQVHSERDDVEEVMRIEREIRSARSRYLDAARERLEAV